MFYRDSSDSFKWSFISLYSSSTKGFRSKSFLVQKQHLSRWDMALLQPKVTDLFGTKSDTYGYGHSNSGYSGAYSSQLAGSYSSGYDDCCPLVVDPLTFIALLSFLAAAVYLLNEQIAMSMLMMPGKKRKRRQVIFGNLLEGRIHIDWKVFKISEYWYMYQSRLRTLSISCLKDWSKLMLLLNWRHFYYTYYFWNFWNSSVLSIKSRESMLKITAYRPMHRPFGTEFSLLLFFFW